MRTILKSTLIIILLTIFVNNSYGQLPVIEVAETYIGNIQPRIASNEPNNNIDEVFSNDLTAVELSFVKHQNGMGFLTLYLDYTNDSEIIGIRTQLLYSIDTIKRGASITTHYMALGKGNTNELFNKFMVITLITDKDNRVNTMEMTLVGDKTKFVVPGLSLTETETF